MARKKKYDRYTRILAFDPSIQNMGYSVLDYDPTTNKTILFRTGKIQGNLIYKNPELRKDNAGFDKRFTILEGIRLEILRVIALYKPAYIVAESAFYQRFINAVIVLTLVIHQIRLSAKKYNNKDIYLVAPKQTKSEITGNSNADKLEIKTSLQKNADKLNIIIPKSIDLDKITFDEIDSIGHGLTFIKLVLPNLIVLDNFEETKDTKEIKKTKKK